MGLVCVITAVIYLGSSSLFYLSPIASISFHTNTTQVLQRRRLDNVNKIDRIATVTALGTENLTLSMMLFAVEAQEAEEAPLSSSHQFIT